MFTETVPDTDADGDGITDHHEWTDGDFEIITSDRYRFRVPSAYLLCHR
jgi:hypothetical protein